MIAEKSLTTQHLTDQISSGASKVPYLSNEVLMKALDFLEKKGIPSNKHEDYKYCNLDALIRKEFQNCAQKFKDLTEIENYKTKGMLNLILINGNYSPELSDHSSDTFVYAEQFSKLKEDERKKIASLARVDEDAFIALNTAFSTNGLYLKVRAGSKPTQALRVLNLVNAGSDLFLNARYFVHLEENSQLELIEEQVVLGDQKVFLNFLSERLLEKGSQLKVTQIQQQGNKDYCVNTVQAELARQSEYTCTTVSLGGQLIRNNHNVVLNGDYSAAHLYGLFVCGGNTLVDNHTLMDHRVPNCESNELYKGVAYGKGTGVFNGKIFVRKDAQKTNAYQSSKNILLSDEATINTKPQLEIYANDVKCSHGTSTGRIDEAALFYLKSRGIGEQSARKLLLQAFAQEVMDTVGQLELKDMLSRNFEAKIGLE